ncbi:MAG: hypothetical protein ACP5SH_22190, partial [Syntrophobacteraceae bacterium]
MTCNDLEAKTLSRNPGGNSQILRYPGLIVAIFALLALCLAAVPARASTETATTTIGGNWTGNTTWTCAPGLSPCVPDNGTPAGSTYGVQISGGAVLLNSGSSPANISIDSLGLTGGNLQIYDGSSLSVSGDAANSSASLYIGNTGSTNDSSLSVGGNLSNSNYMQVGNGFVNGLATITGNLSNTGGDLQLLGGTSGHQTTVTVGAAAPATLTGQ